MSQVQSDKVKTPAPPILGVHHAAYRCRDAEETRQFYEGVLGLRTKATLAFETDPGGSERPFMHLFFEMEDGNFIAFFDLPHTVHPSKFNVKDGMEDWHVAMEVKDYGQMMQFKQRLEEFDVPVFGPIDHKFCHSIYFFDPNGMALEFTVRDAEHNSILDKEEAESPEAMQKWMKETAAVRRQKLQAAAEAAE